MQSFDKKTRKIIHVDMDCFFAAVEMRDEPKYQNIPIAIGGASSRRSVLSTCNYLAREYGVHSAMPSFKAMQICPNLVIVPSRMQLYINISKQLKEIFYRYTDLVEPLSLDEAFLDVTDCTLFQGSATYIAQDILNAISRELNLTASAGVAPCKFLAKIASDENKPNGLFVLTPDKVQDFVYELPLKKIPGVGKVAQQKLALKGLFKCSDLQGYPLDKLVLEFGKLGHSLIDYSRGIDERIIEPSRTPKSVAVERTFEKDIHGFEQSMEKLELFYEELERRLKKVDQEQVVVKLGVKMKFSDFSVKSAERRTTKFQRELFEVLLKQLLEQNIDQTIRLLGIYVGLETKVENDQKDKQLSLI